MNLLPLEDWRRIIGLHPYYFWNLTTASIEPRYPNDKPGSICDRYIRRYAWQGADYLGRDEIESAIETAERKLRDYLGYAIAPEYREETVLWPRYYDTTVTRWANWDTSGRFISVALPFGSGRVQALGTELRTLIGTVTTAGASLVFSDANGDGLNDTFTATIATTETDPDKIAVYLAAADRLDSEDISERWRIRPVKVQISGGNAVIRGAFWLLAKPVLYEGILTQPLDPTVLANFVNSLLVYTRTTEPDGTTVDTAQGTVIWETQPCHGWFCCCACCSEDPGYSPADSSLDPSAIGMAIARVGMRDPVMGRVTVGEAVLNATTGIWSGMSWSSCHQPDRVTVRYLAGHPLENGQVAQKYQKLVAHLAAAEMTKPICGCESANKLVHYWSFDLARTSGNNDERFAISAKDLENPFGTKRGQVEAWHEVRNLRLTPGLVGH